MKWYVLTAFLYALFFGFYIWGYKNKKQFNYPSSSLFNTYGLDVSHHQGEIDWKKVGEQKYKFVYIKATEGLSFKDKRFLENYSQAKASGLKVGGYHFWLLCKDTEKQLQNIFQNIPKSSEDLVPVVDIETIVGCEAEVASGRVDEVIFKINKAFEAHYGKKPILYTTKEFSKTYPHILDFKNKYWLRSLVGQPMGRKVDWTIWQYYNVGSVKGIKGAVDLNVLSPRKSLDSITQK